MENIEKELKKLILSKYRSIREFAFDIDMPYTTLDSIFKRGISNASISNIIKICNKLNISADKLAVGELQNTVEMSNVDLIKNNKVLSEIYSVAKKLSEAEQLYILDVIKTYRKHIEKK